MKRPIVMAVLLLSLGNASAQEVQETQETPKHTKSNATASTLAPTPRHDGSLFPRQAMEFREPHLPLPTSHSSLKTRIGRIDIGRGYQWRNATLYGTAGRDVMTGLMEKQDAEVGIAYLRNSLFLNVGLMANVYSLNQLTRLDASPLRNQFGVSGSLRYNFSENLSATVYGQYVSNPFYHSSTSEASKAVTSTSEASEAVTMAAFPYIATSSFGGYITLQNERLGVDLGVNNYYDPLIHNWRTDPIVRPTYKIGKVKIGMDIGPLVKEGILRLAGKKRPAHPMILP